MLGHGSQNYLKGESQKIDRQAWWVIHRDRVELTETSGLVSASAGARDPVKHRRAGGRSGGRAGERAVGRAGD